MRSIVFFLLSVCYVVSSKKVNVHVKEVSEYKTLQFKYGSPEETKDFTLTGTTTASTVEVKDGVIRKTNWEIGIEPTSASILEVIYGPITINFKQKCTQPADVNCIEPKTPADFIIYATGITAEYTTMTCIGSSGGQSENFKLVHKSKSEIIENSIPVETNNTITGQVISLSFQPTECTSEKAGGGGDEAGPQQSGSISDVSKETIKIPFKMPCKDPATGDTPSTNCIGPKALFDCIINAKDVKKQQTEMKCTGKASEEKETFTLKHESVAAHRSTEPIKVTAGGEIKKQPISLSFVPEKCEISEATLTEKPLKNTKSQPCVAGQEDCFQIVAEESGNESSTDKTTVKPNTSAASDNIFRLALLVTCAILGMML